VVTTSEQGDKVTTAFVFAVIAWRIAAREDERERIDLRTRTDAEQQVNAGGGVTVGTCCRDHWLQ
jgi:hypothetical protein